MQRLSGHATCRSGPSPCLRISSPPSRPRGRPAACRSAEEGPPRSVVQRPADISLPCPWTGVVALPPEDLTMTEAEKLSKRRRKTGWRECAGLTVRQLPTAAPTSSTMTQPRRRLGPGGCASCSSCCAANPAGARWPPYCVARGGDGPAHRPQLRLRAAGHPVSLTKADFLNRVSHARLHWPSRFDAEVAVTTSAGPGCPPGHHRTDPPATRPATWPPPLPRAPRDKIRLP